MYIAFTDLKVRMMLQTYLMLVLINKLSWKANLQELNLSHQETSNVTVPALMMPIHSMPHCPPCLSSCSVTRPEKLKNEIGKCKFHILTYSDSQSLVNIQKNPVYQTSSRVTD